MWFPFKRRKCLHPSGRLPEGHWRGVWRFTYFRQALLFLLAVVLPSGTLTVLTFRMIAQERELEVKRGRERREQAAREFGTELSRRLDAIAASIVSLSVSELRVGRWKHLEPELELAAVVLDDQLLLPWQHQSGTEDAGLLPEQSAFGVSFHAGQQLEFETEDLQEALASYRRAQALASSPLQTAHAGLAAVRVLTKLNSPAEVETSGRALLRLPWTLRDEFGIPLAFYAAGHLMGTRDTLSEVRNLIEQAAKSWFLPPAALYMAQDYLVQLKPRLTDEIEALEKVSQRLTEQLTWQAGWERIKSEWHILRANLSRDASPDRLEFKWTLYGRQSSLVCIAPLRSAQGEVFLSIRSQGLAERAAQALLPSAERGLPPDDQGNRPWPRIVRGPHPEGYWLGGSFSDLQVIFGASDFASPLSGRRHLSIALIAMVVGITLFAAHLWWRDTRRELRLAEMRSDFVSSVSHELKTPLTSMRMLAETMRLRDLGLNERREYLDLILSESERLGRLLKNVLDFASVEKGLKRFQIGPAPLEPIVAAAVRCIQQPLREKNLELQVAGSTQDLILRADADAVEQALLNLLHNAVKYSHRDGRIELETSATGCEVRIQVRDYGFGIHPRAQQRIFERFYRSPEEHNRQIPGTGLGLALVQHIMEAHAGRVTVQSAPGQGSTFSLHLPLERGPA